MKIEDTDVAYAQGRADTFVKLLHQALDDALTLITFREEGVETVFAHKGLPYSENQTHVQLEFNYSMGHPKAPIKIEGKISFPIFDVIGSVRVKGERKPPDIESAYD
jgi:hypothetical protein